jgi:signal transduction histidine kinase
LASLGKRPFVLSIAGGCLLAAITGLGFVLIGERPAVPRSISPESLVAIDGREVRFPEDRNFALAWKQIGDEADFTAKGPDGALRTVSAPIEAYYAGSVVPLIYLLIGVVSFVLGFLTLLLKPADLKARIFFWLAAAFGLAVIVSGEDYCLHPERWVTFLPSCAFILCYALIPALLVRFAAALAPRPPRRPFWILVPALLIALFQQAVFLAAFLTPSPAIYRFYARSYAVFRAYLVVYVLLAIALLIRAYRRAVSEETQAQVRWIALGIAGGAVPFIFLYQIWMIFGLSPLLSEDVSTLFFVAFPLGFAIAIIRHRLMDVRIVVNRGLVYSILTAFTVGVYLLVVEAARGLFARTAPGGQGLTTVVGVFLAAAAFQPAHKKIQDLVDRTFFRQRYDYRRVVLDFSDRAGRALDRDQLLARSAGTVREALPTGRLSLVVSCRPFGEGSGPCRWAAGDPFEADPLAEAGFGPTVRLWARESAVLAADDVDFSRSDWLSRQGAALLLFLPLNPRVGTGFLALGVKRSGRRFSREDVELLRTLSGELAVNLERLYLQEEVFVERASKEKLAEIDREKTEFISTVSHELRTPMTAIQGLAEILQAGKIKSREQSERYLGLMVAESARLSRFLHNILDIGRIEREAKTYHLAPADLRTLAEEASAVFREPLEAGGYSFRVGLPDRPVIRAVDADAVKQALINLLDNAVKYSGEGREIGIEVRDGDMAEVRVWDRGIGIAPEDRERIFERFFRSERASRFAPHGAGLGLRIVRHIMDGHGGRVVVESAVNAGSVFRLLFPSA